MTHVLQVVYGVGRMRKPSTSGREDLNKGNTAGPRTGCALVAPSQRKRFDNKPLLIHDSTVWIPRIHCTQPEKDQDQKGGWLT